MIPHSTHSSPQSLIVVLYPDRNHSIDSKTPEPDGIRVPSNKKRSAIALRSSSKDTADPKPVPATPTPTAGPNPTHWSPFQFKHAPENDGDEDDGDEDASYLSSASELSIVLNPLDFRMVPDVEWMKSNADFFLYFLLDEDENGPIFRPVTAQGENDAQMPNSDSMQLDENDVSSRGNGSPQYYYASSTPSQSNGRSLNSGLMERPVVPTPTAAVPWKSDLVEAVAPSQTMSYSYEDGGKTVQTLQLQSMQELAGTDFSGIFSPTKVPSSACIGTPTNDAVDPAQQLALYTSTVSANRKKRRISPNDYTPDTGDRQLNEAKDLDLVFTSSKPYFRLVDHAAPSEREHYHGQDENMAEVTETPQKWKDKGDDLFKILSDSRPPLPPSSTRSWSEPRSINNRSFTGTPHLPRTALKNFHSEPRPALPANSKFPTWSEARPRFNLAFGGTPLMKRGCPSSKPCASPAQDVLAGVDLNRTLFGIEDSPDVASDTSYLSQFAEDSGLVS